MRAGFRPGRHRRRQEPAEAVARGLIVESEAGRGEADMAHHRVMD
jgi:3-methyladenine DNA glycosylase Mpg